MVEVCCPLVAREIYSCPCVSTKLLLFLLFICTLNSAKIIGNITHAQLSQVTRSLLRRHVAREVQKKTLQIQDCCEGNVGGHLRHSQ